MLVGTQTNVSIIRTCVTSVLLYACETWTLRKRDIYRLADGTYNEMLYKRKLHIHRQLKMKNFIENTKVGHQKECAKQKRKTEQGVDGRHQRMVPGRRTHTRHNGACRTDENRRELSLRHWTPTGGSPWNEEEDNSF